MYFFSIHIGHSQLYHTKSPLTMIVEASTQHQRRRKIIINSFGELEALKEEETYQERHDILLTFLD